jgi:hypothetical protein
LRHPAQLEARHDAQLDRDALRPSPPARDFADMAKTESFRSTWRPEQLGQATVALGERTSRSKSASHCGQWYS